MKRNKRHSLSPLQRSLRYLTEQGFTVQKVEVWNPFSKTRNDLFGFGDLLAFHPEKHINLIVQTTTREHMIDRKLKILGNFKAIAWLRIQTNKIEVHGWAKRFDRGKVRPRYELVVAEVKV